MDENSIEYKKAFEPYRFPLPIILIIISLIWLEGTITQMLISFASGDYNLVYLVLLALGIMVLVFGVKGLRKAILTKNIMNKGQKTKGKIVKLWIDVLPRKGSYNRNIHMVFFKCYSDTSMESYSKQEIPEYLYEKLERKEDNNVPILVYKGKALLDIEELKKETAFTEFR